MGERHARFRIWIAAAALMLVAVAASATSAAGPNFYVVTNLVSDEPGVAPVLDPNLANPWGLDALAGSPWWVADNETDVSTLYQANGTKVALTVAIPGGAPTGLVANAGSSFVVTNSARSGVSRFIFATQNGVIAGWSPAVDPTHAVTAVNNPDAVYTGLAIAGDRLYAADFLGAKRRRVRREFDLDRRSRTRSSIPSFRKGTRPSGSRTSAARSSSPTRSRTRRSPTRRSKGRIGCRERVRHER